MVLMDQGLMVLMNHGLMFLMDQGLMVLMWQTDVFPTVPEFQDHNKT